MQGEVGEIESKLRFIRKICSSSFIHENLEDISISLRFLRKVCSSNSDSQCFVAKHGLEDIEKLLKLLFGVSDLSSENVRICIRLGLQVIGNMTVNNNETQIVVWEKCGEIFSVALKFEDEKAVNYSAMIIHNIILGRSQNELDVDNLDVNVIKGLITSASNGSEFGFKYHPFSQFALESLLSIPHWLEKYYSELTSGERYYILDLISTNLSVPRDSDIDEKKEIHSSAITFISREFCENADAILNSKWHPEKKGNNEKDDEFQDGSSSTTDPCEITKFLEILSTAASVYWHLPLMQADGILLVQAIYLLKSIHAIGKLAEEDGNLEHPFASIQRLSDVDTNKTINREDIEVHPVFGFKRNIIRLIGNLAWKNKEIQEKILELECIPLILDCCNIDERNPFITQWAILAIRNLCDRNLEVQKVIAGLKKEGVVNCDLLNEMGLTLQDPDDPNKKISIVPLPRLMAGLMRFYIRLSPLTWMQGWEVLNAKSRNYNVSKSPDVSKFLKQNL